MARYIDADALKLDIDLSKGASVLDLAISVIKAVKEAPDADVVPKSEVAELEIKLRQLEDKLRQYEQVCGKLAIKDGVAVGLIDGKETVYILKSISKVVKELAVRRTKVEVAREIFEEIDVLVDDWKHSRIQSIQFIAELAELKKKYTEEKE